jgi:predicted Rossmann fold nucleotide-binding protein DprA/Smf involved in DNA uptake
VISGGAIGIDTAAHLGALAGRGPTLVIAPTWYDVAYPKRNAPLFEKIIQAGGGYLTVSPTAARPLPYVFFRRNEALVATSHAIVLGECPHKSGAKNAMLHARRLRRPRFALPFGFASPGSRGTAEEVLTHGAEILADEQPVLRLLEEYGDFDNERWLTYLGDLAEKAPDATRRRRPQLGWDFDGGLALGGAEPEPPCFSPQAWPLVSERGRLTLASVAAGNRTVEQICQATGLGPPSVQHEILCLLMEGAVSEDEAGLLRYHSRPHE